jgi:hypothetical protein
MEFTSDGILFLEEGTSKLTSKLGQKKVEHKQRKQIIDGEWNITFTKGWGAPESVALPELTSWTNNENKGVKYYSGIGTYHKTFQFQKISTLSKDERIFIDLGNLSKIGEVWINGHSLGITWAKPYRFDITNVIKNGSNTLRIEIANTWSNRLTGDAITGEKYTETNILNTIVPGSNIWHADQTRVPWAKVPLIESGLLGPVSIQTHRLVR